MQRRRIAVAVVGVLALAVVLAGVFSIYSYRRPLPQTEGAQRVPGLVGNVTIYRDDWGVPHLYANTADDLFMALGYVHAQDRWWQMELLRHTNTGRLSEIFGDDARVQATDRFVRRMGWPNIAARHVAEADPATADALAAYALGVNAYQAERDPADLAVEYTVLGLAGRGFDVMPWRAEDSAALALGLAWGGDITLLDELTTAQYIAQLPPDLYRPEWEPADLDYSAYAWTLSEALALGENPYLRGLAWYTGANWVLARPDAAPLLAASPQNGQHIPALWYEVGLHCIETTLDCPYNMVGMSVAGVPGVFAGHNAQIAWALSPLPVDTQDVYALQVDAQAPTVYRVEGQAQRMTSRREVITVNDSEPLELDIYQTRLGPIITDVTPGAPTQPLALRWAGAEGPSFIGPLLALNRAGDWDAFQAALVGWHSPVVMGLYADTGGNIGAAVGGAWPQRDPAHSGAWPVPAEDARYVWRGLIRDPALRYNPAEGYLIASAAPILGESVPLAEGYRAARMAALLTRNGPHNADTFASLQADTYNAFALAVLPYLLDLPFPDDPRALAYQTWLSEWAGENTRESAPPVLFAFFWAQLVEDVYTDQAGELESSDQHAWLLPLLDDPLSPWWDDARTLAPVETRDDILRAAFLTAIDEAEATFGEARERWRWGDLHQTEYVNYPLGESGIAAIEELLNRADVATGGGYGAVYGTRWRTQRAGRYSVERVPGFRMIIDLDGFAANRSILATGQSGHPASEHYDDMIALWSNVAYRDMLWAEADIRGRSADTLRLQPGAVPAPEDES